MNLSGLLIVESVSKHLTIGRNAVHYGLLSREIQREPVSGRIIHVDVQIMSKEHVQSFKIPLVFVGEGELKNRLLALSATKALVTYGVTIFTRSSFLSTARML